MTGETQVPIVAAIQMTSGADVAANLDAAGRLLDESRRAGAHVAVLPENFAFMGVREADKLAVAEPPGGGPIQEFLVQAAARLSLWIVGGTVPLKTPGARVAAACLVFDAGGKRVARYDKMHLFDVDVPGEKQSGGGRYRESTTIAPGVAEAAVTDTPAGRMGLSVCYDVRFPELYRRLAAGGAEIIAVPSAFTERTGQAHWEVLLRARAIENQCYVVAPGQCGEHPGGRRTYGHSLIVDPWGKLLAEAKPGPGVVVAKVPREPLASLRKTFPVLDHRRL
jgi:deaminated glutathione amidase